MTDTPEPPQEKENENESGADEKQVKPKRHRKAFAIGFFAATYLAIVSFLALDSVMEPWSSPDFCASCHEMTDVYESWKVSAHNVNHKGISPCF